MLIFNSFNLYELTTSQILWRVVTCGDLWQPFSGTYMCVFLACALASRWSTRCFLLVCLLLRLLLLIFASCCTLINALNVRFDYSIVRFWYVRSDSRSLWLSPNCFARCLIVLACSRFAIYPAHSLSRLRIRYLACAFACSIAHARLLDCSLVRLFALAHSGSRPLASLAACLFSLTLTSLCRLRSDSLV